MSGVRNRFLWSLQYHCCRYVRTRSPRLSLLLPIIAAFLSTFRLFPPFFFTFANAVIAVVSFYGDIPPGSYSFSRVRDTVAPLLCAHIEHMCHQIQAGQWFVLPKPTMPGMKHVLESEGKFCVDDKCVRDVDGSKCIVVDLREGE